MTPQWGKVEFVNKAHFYLANGKSICNWTKLWVKNGIVRESDLKPSEVDNFCCFCKNKLEKKMREII